MSRCCMQKGGAFAEYAIASVARTVLRPAEVSAVEGACAVVAGYTALQSARQAGIQSFAGGSEHLNVLIPGASGGVGIFLLQLVKLAGAHATVTCGERNMELMRNLKADEVLDYRTPEAASYTSPSGQKIPCRAQLRALRAGGEIRRADARGRKSGGPDADDGGHPGRPVE